MKQKAPKQQKRLTLGKPVAVKLTGILLTRKNPLAKRG